QHLVGRHPQHLLHVDRGRRHEDVDAEALGTLQGLVGLVDVVGMGPSQAGDDRPSHVVGDAGYGLEVPRGGGGEARLQYVYSQTAQLMGDGYFLVGGECDAGGLFPVSQSGIEDDQTVAHAFSSSEWWVFGWSVTFREAGSSSQTPGHRSARSPPQERRERPPGNVPSRLAVGASSVDPSVPDWVCCTASGGGVGPPPACTGDDDSPPTAPSCVSPPPS